jgi:hypothetical protein
MSPSEIVRMGKMAGEICDTGFSVTDCYNRWSVLTENALAVRFKTPRLEAAASYIDSVNPQPLEEL